MACSLMTGKVVITHLKSHQEHQAANKMIEKGVNSKKVHASQTQEKQERHSKHSHGFKQCVDLCVKNLDVSVDDELLHEEFSTFATIINAKGIRFNGWIRFASLSSLEEATKAMREMQRRMLIKCKEIRQASLSSQGMQPLQNSGLNHQQPAPPCGKVIDAIPQAHNSTASNTCAHRATQDIWMQCFHNGLEVNDPAVTHLQTAGDKHG